MRKLKKWRGNTGGCTGGGIAEETLGVDIRGGMGIGGHGW